MRSPSWFPSQADEGNEPGRQVKVQAETAGPAGTAGKRVGRYRYLVLAVIWTAFLFGGFDRAAFSLFLVDHDFLRAMGIEGSPERQGC